MTVRSAAARKKKRRLTLKHPGDQAGCWLYRGCYRAESASVWVTLAPSLPVVKVLRMKKFAALVAAGVKTVRSPADIGEALKAIYKIKLAVPANR